MTFEPSSIFGLSLDRLDRARVGEDRQASRSPKSIDTWLHAAFIIQRGIDSGCTGAAFSLVELMEGFI